MLVSIDPPGLFAKPAQWQSFVADMEQRLAEGHEDARPWLEWGRKHLGTHDFDPDQPRDPQGKWTGTGGGTPAYHGSPYAFSEFASKVGSGEGTDAFGHGLYFSENRAVAEHYRRALSGLRGQPAGGVLYEVDLDVERSKLLDWDKPLSQQPEISKILRDQIGTAATPFSGETNKDIADLLRKDAKGEAIMERVSGSPQGVLHKLKEGSDALHEIGIQGVKYLDKRSRAKGEGTSNYVVFDPKRVHIVHAHQFADAAKKGIRVFFMGLGHPHQQPAGGGDAYDDDRARYDPGEISVHGGEFAPEGGAVGGPDYEPGGVKYEEGRRLTSNYIAREASGYKPNSRKVPDVAQELNGRAQKILQQEVNVKEITRENATPQLENYIAKTLAMELKDGLRNGHSTETWYSDKMQRTMQIASKLHPEISADPGKRFAFIAALSIVSQGERVNRAGRNADEAYTRFNKDGKFPTDIKVADPNITGNFQKMNKLIARFGLEGTKKIFDTQYTNRDLLEATGYKVGKTNMDDKVYGSAVLGPKIGQGFYQNLNGNFDPLTMDMWFMRSWGRLTGTGIGHTDMNEQRDKLRTELKRKGKAAPSSMERLLGIAQKTIDVHEADYKETRRPKTPLEHAAERFVYNYSGAMVEAPKGGNDRIWITSVFDKALNLLHKEGTHLTRASGQATWWTPEQGLYKRLGARVPQYDTDYAKVFERIAREKGVTVDAKMTLEFAPWIDDPDSPDNMTEAEMDRMVEGFVHLQSKAARDYDPDQPRVPKGSGEGSGEWTAAGGGGGFEFVSPNIEHTGFEGALRGLTGDRQRALRLAATEIDGTLGLDSVHTNIVGAWSDGAENSILSEVENPDWDKLKLSGAMKGYLADQKSVLLFKQDDKGKAVLYKWAMPGTLESAHRELMQAGITDHTLQKQTSGVTAYVVDRDGKLHDKIAHASSGADVEYQFGRAEFIGTTKDDGTDRQQRDDARRAYAEIIKQSPIQNGTEVWDRVHNRWGEALNPKSGKVIQIGRNQPFEVMINPSERDLRSMVRESSDQEIRVLLDKDNNLFAWDARHAIHASVEDELQLKAKEWDNWILHRGKLVSGRYFRPNPNISEDVQRRHLRQGETEVRSWLKQVPAIAAFNTALRDASASMI